MSITIIAVIMDTFEIKDDEINVEEIMRQIRENIKKRRESGAYTKEMEEIISEPLQAPPAGAVQVQYDLQPDLDYINRNYDLHAEYHVSSHRRVLGRFLVWGRRLVHGEVRRYVDLLAGKQSEFNAGVVRTLNNCIKGFDSKMNEAVAAVNNDIKNKAWLANLLDKRIKRNITKLKPLSEEQTDKVMNYFVFEEKFRGSTEDIKQRQSIFLEYFKNCQNVLDIGYGRGEFFSLLKENSTGAKGIDINQDMVLYCQKNGLDVQKAEALGYLGSLEDKSLDGVFSAQVVEHLQPGELISMVKLCYDMMKFGTYFIAETVNSRGITKRYNC